MSAVDRARIELERTYDIPFLVRETIEEQELCYYIGPKSKEKELFVIRLTCRNGVRLIMELIPGKYSAHFISEMGEKSEEKKNLFASYKDTLEMKGAKCVVRVNNTDLDFNMLASWPTRWEQVEIRVTKMNAFDLDAAPIELLSKSEEWYSLMVGMILSLADIVPTDVDDGGYEEGAKKKETSTRYERNPLNRKLCLELHGYKCEVCGFDFQKTYGKLGEKFIHVHHVTPVSQLGEHYIINPSEDLVPVCPNCHAMLHKKTPPLSVDELKTIINAPLEERADE